MNPMHRQPGASHWQLARMAAMAPLAWLAILAASVLMFAAPANAAEEPLPAEKAYHYAARVEGDRLIVKWTVEPGYYLYKKKMSVASTLSGVQVGEPSWPKGENHHDDYFGDQEIYRGSFEMAAPLEIAGARPQTLSLELKLQGCADAGFCHPPQKWKTSVELPAAGVAAAANRNLGLFFPKKNTTAENDFLPPDEAFKFGAGLESAGSVALTWIIADGYYLYRDRITVTADGAATIGKPVMPKGETKHDENFGDVVVYHEMLEASLPLSRAANSSGKLNLKVTYQGCAEGGLCYNPMTKTVALDLPPTNVATQLPAQVEKPTSTFVAAATGTPIVAEQDRLAAALRGDNVFYALFTFFGAGLLLSLTPCVLPMIPILSGIIVGQGDKVTRARSFSLAFTYVQGMALTYAAAGAIFVLAFKQAPQAFFQQPWIITLMVLLFVALAFAMFGAYTLQLPSALQTRLTNVSNQQKSGTYIGTFIMGALSALVVTACVAPAIIAALSVISQSKQIFLGAAALYATGLGMGVPLLIVGASAGSLLPKAGPWMDTIKQLFGVLFLGVAVYLLEPLVPAAVSMLLWAALAVISGFWIFSLKARDGGPAASPIRAGGLLVLIYGVILLLGLASGGQDPLEPLDQLSVRAGGSGPAAPKSELVFQRIKSVTDLNREVAAASAAGKPVMLDFYADWCASCKEMEKYVFTDPAVKEALANVVLLQADVTANNDDDKGLFERFGIFGPPTIAFFDAAGAESKNHRVVGYMKADKFAPHVRTAIAGG